MANINKNIIMQAGAAVANATNKAAGLPASTPEPGAIISAIQLVNGGRTIGPDALAHFTESVRNKLLSLLVTMEPIQDFNGYGHPWPAGGGKNKLSLSSVSLGGTEARTKRIDIEPITAGTYKMSGVNTGTVTTDIGFQFYDAISGGTNVGSSYLGGTLTLTGEAVSVYCYMSTADYNNGKTVIIGNMQIEAGNSITDYAPYSNICPISGRTGANGYVSPTPNVADATTYTADWTTPAGTVYAGSADIVTGDIKAAPYYASYNGETLVGPWVSSMDEYDPDGTPTTGAQVVDLGGTMTEYHITGQDIITLVGDNYIWSDSGDVTITE